jgi:hypothetical protein
LDRLHDIISELTFKPKDYLKQDLQDFHFFLQNFALSSSWTGGAGACQEIATSIHHLYFS